MPTYGSRRHHHLPIDDVMPLHDGWQKEIIGQRQVLGSNPLHGNSFPAFPNRPA